MPSFTGAERKRTNCVSLKVPTSQRMAPLSQVVMVAAISSVFTVTSCSLGSPARSKRHWARTSRKKIVAEMLQVRAGVR